MHKKELLVIFVVTLSLRTRTRKGTINGERASERVVFRVSLRVFHFFHQYNA